MTKKDITYLKHILDAIDKIEEYIKNRSYRDFLTNSLLQDGVIRQLEIVGEAAKRLSRNFQSKHPEIPWKDIIGMRNKLIHDYFGVDTDAVWNTAKEDILILKKHIQEILKEKGLKT